MIWHDLGDFMRENMAMFGLTIIFLALMVFFLSVEIYQSKTETQQQSINSLVPNSKVIDPIFEESQSSLSKVRMPTPLQSLKSLPVNFLPVRPAQIGIPDKEEATERVVQIVNSVPELSALPKNIKAGFTFYIQNPDGSSTDIPESNLSFTLEPTGRLRFGLVAGLNVKVRLPISRLEDLSQNFCQGVAEGLNGDEFGFDWDLSATDKIALIAASVPVRSRCQLNE